MTPCTRALASAALLFLSSAARAQEPNPHDGNWRAEYEDARGGTREGRVTVRDREGTWDMAVTARNNPCVGRAVPIAVQQAGADELVFVIRRSEVLPGCRDGRATLRRVDADTLEGEFDGGRRLRLLRR